MMLLILGVNWGGFIWALVHGAILEGRRHKRR